jgi:periplasmic copper chaperone A
MRFSTLFLAGLVCVTLTHSAEAHVSISSGPAAANKSQIITFSVGHGCTDAALKKLDTVKIRVAIPAGVTSVRPLFSDFGRPTLIKNGATLTHVEWTKAAGDLLDGDEAYYEIKLRANVPNAPFTKLQFNVDQTCEDSTTHAQVVVSWDQPETSTTGEPAPLLSVVPARTSGWNKFVAPRALTQDEVATYLGDALIVWRGTAAYSSNAATAALITNTPSVTALTAGLQANDEIWVRY